MRISKIQLVDGSEHTLLGADVTFDHLGVAFAREPNPRDLSYVDSERSIIGRSRASIIDSTF